MAREMACHVMSIAIDVDLCLAGGIVKCGNDFVSGSGKQRIKVNG
jgi:hypothetical protein